MLVQYLALINTRSVLPVVFILILSSCTVQSDSHQPPMITQHLKYDQSELRCVVNVKYTPDFEDLIQKRHVKYVACIVAHVIFMALLSYRISFQMKLQSQRIYEIKVVILYSRWWFQLLLSPAVQEGLYPTPSIIVCQTFSSLPVRYVEMSS